MLGSSDDALGIVLGYDERWLADVPKVWVDLVDQHIGMPQYEFGWLVCWFCKVSFAPERHRQPDSGLRSQR